MHEDEHGNLIIDPGDGAQLGKQRIVLDRDQATSLTSTLRLVKDGNLPSDQVGGMEITVNLKNSKRQTRISVGTLLARLGVKL